MTHTNEGRHDPCETLARLVSRLSGEIRHLTRAIPLQEGLLLELQNQPVPDGAALRRVAETIHAERQCLETTEHDLVVLEVLIQRNCGPCPERQAVKPRSGHRTRRSRQPGGAKP